MMQKLREWPVGITLSTVRLRVPEAWLNMLQSELLSLAKEHADLPKDAVILDARLSAEIIVTVPIVPVSFSETHTVNTEAKPHVEGGVQGVEGGGVA